MPLSEVAKPRRASLHSASAPGISTSCHSAKLIRSSVVGAGFALGLVAISLIALHLGSFVGATVTYPPIHNEPAPSLLLYAVLGIPLQTAIPEELAFRDLLLGLLTRNLSSWRAAIVTSAVFVARHVVVQTQTLAHTNVTSPWLMLPAASVAVLALFVGGLVFAFLRLRTHNLAAAAVAHWWFDAGLMLDL